MVEMPMIDKLLSPSEEVSVSTEEQMASSHEMASKALELAEMAGELQAIVAHFVLLDNPATPGIRDSETMIGKRSASQGLPSSASNITPSSVSAA
jgi:hypothetical protein